MNRRGLFVGLASALAVPALAFLPKVEVKAKPRSLEELIYDLNKHLKQYEREFAKAAKATTVTVRDYRTASLRQSKPLKIQVGDKGPELFVPAS